MGKPIINGVEGFAAEFIDKAGAGINIEPEYSDQLLDALLSIRDDPALRESLGKSGQDRVVRSYDRDKLAEDYLTIIEKIMNADAVQT